MNYAEALAYLESCTDYERVPRPDDPTRFQLGRVVELLGLLGHPEARFGALHVVGTKGKGSTSVMLAGALKAAGWRVGLYTSPHLHSFCERIQIDGHLISERALADLVEVVRPMVEREHAAHAELGRLTTFEVATAVALEYFARERVDYAVLEAGLGGRLDATNVVQPLITVLTPIGLDHTQYLGTTLSAIAREKAAVIKPKGVVVSAEQRPEAMAVVDDLAVAAEAQLNVIGREWNWRLQADGTIVVRGPEREYADIRVPLLGNHQLENAALAVAALDGLRRRGLVVPADAVRDGIARVRWPGRLETLAERPLLVVDGAHNPESMRRLREALQAHLGTRRLILVLGTSADKDLAGIAAEIVPAAARVIVTRSRHARGAPVAELAGIVARQGAAVEVVEGVANAVARARESADAEDAICVTGSLFVVADAREAVLGPAGVGIEQRGPGGK